MPAMNACLRVFGCAMLLVLLGAAPAIGQTYTRQQLIEDVYQLSDLIESAHPDPYIRGGGKILYHIRLQDVLRSIPDAGMTRDEFIRILRPFVAGVGDSHTEIWTSYRVDELRPGGIPLRFRVVENRLVVGYVIRESDLKYVGATLVSVEGISVSELAERQKRLVALENDYHVLEELCSHTLWYAPYLRDLIPEWENTASIGFELETAAGDIVRMSEPVPVLVRQFFGPESAIRVPEPDGSGFVYAFLDAPEPLARAGTFAYLRVDHMTGYGELDEMAGRTSSTLPFVTHAFRSLVIDMAEAGTQTLVVDLRYNGGGDSIMSDILVYFLYGRDVLRDVFAHAALSGGGMAVKLSEFYFESPYNAPLEERNVGQEIPWRLGDYDFTEFIGGRGIAFEDLPPEEQALYTDGRYCERTATFCAEYESGAYAGHYCPQHVLVLVSPWTFSSGLTMARHLYLAGATLIGTPSAQASNSFCNADRWVLGHTGIEGQISRMYFAEFPVGSELAHTLPVHVPLTYEQLASLGFDPNAELLLALAIPEP